MTSPNGSAGLVSPGWKARFFAVTKGRRDGTEKPAKRGRGRGRGQGRETMSPEEHEFFKGFKYEKPGQRDFEGRPVDEVSGELREKLRKSLAKDYTLLNFCCCCLVKKMVDKNMEKKIEGNNNDDTCEEPPEFPRRSKYRSRQVKRLVDLGTTAAKEKDGDKSSDTNGPRRSPKRERLTPSPESDKQKSDPSTEKPAKAQVARKSSHASVAEEKPTEDGTPAEARPLPVTSSSDESLRLLRPGLDRGWASQRWQQPGQRRRGPHYLEGADDIADDPTEEEKLSDSRKVEGDREHVERRSDDSALLKMKREAAAATGKGKREGKQQERERRRPEPSVTGDILTERELIELFIQLADSASSALVVMEDFGGSFVRHIYMSTITKMRERTRQYFYSWFVTEKDVSYMTQLHMVKEYVRGDFYLKY